MERQRFFTSDRKRYVALFFALFSLFFIARFPLQELRSWAISRTADEAGVRIYLKDSSFLLPLGLELNDLRISGKEAAFASPRIKSLKVRVSPLSLLSGEKEFRFQAAGATGEARGSIKTDGVEARLNMESSLFDIGGLMPKEGLLVERGQVSINGDVKVSPNYLEGEGVLHVKGADLFIKGISPLVSELPLKTISARLEKKGDKIKVESLSMELEGVILSGQGSMDLASPPGRSVIVFNGKVDMSKAADGPLSGIFSMIKGMTGGGDHFTLQLSGTMDRPDLKVNGKALF